MKKRFLMAVLMLCMVFAFCACGNNAGENNQQNVNNENKEDENNNENNNNEDEGNNEEENDGKVVYTVIVTDEDGNPIAGAKVQVCTEKGCLAPVTTNEEGVAEFRLEESDEYKAILFENPAGYEAVETDYVHFDGETEITLTVTPVE